MHRGGCDHSPHFISLTAELNYNQYNIKMPKPHRDPHAPKRAQSSYLLYQNAHREQFKAEESFLFLLPYLFLMHIMCSIIIFYAISFLTAFFSSI